MISYKRYNGYPAKYAKLNLCVKNKRGGGVFCELNESVEKSKDNKLIKKYAILKFL